MNTVLNCMIRKNTQLFKNVTQIQNLYINRRLLCSQNPVTENEIKTILNKKYPSANKIVVEDVSGGCGAMFNIFIETSEFKGLSIVKQHRSVYDTLKQQIKNIHGLHLETKSS